MKATLNLTDNTILMDCTPQELAGLLCLLHPCPKQEPPSRDTHSDETPAPAEPVRNPEPAPDEPDQLPEPATKEPEPATAEPDQEPEQTPTEPEPDSLETVPAIPPEPAEREPLGKALERLRGEARLRKRLQDDGRHYKYRPVYARDDNGDVIYCDSVAEMAIRLGVTAQCVNQAIRKNHYCKGYKIKEDDPKTIL